MSTETNNRRFAVLTDGKAMVAHMATVNESSGKPSERRLGHAEPMPYRLHIAVAFASLAGALASLYCWCP